MSLEPAVRPSCAGDGEEPPPQREDEQPVPRSHHLPWTGLSPGRGRMESDMEAQSPLKTYETGHGILNKLKRKQLAR